MRPWLTQLIAVAGVIALPALGYSVAQSLLDEREQILEDKVSDQAAEITELVELFRRNRKAVEIVPQSKPEDRVRTPTPQSEDPVAPGTAPIDAYDVYLSSGNSTPLFEGSLTVSLDSIQFSKSPPGYRASFVLRAPGASEKQVKRAVGDYSLDYAGFHVAVDRVEPTGAGFIVSRSSVLEGM